MEKEFPESQAGEIPRRPLPTGVPPGTLNIVGSEMQRSPIVVRLRRTPMFGSRRTDVLEFLSGYSRQRSPHCQDAEKKTAVTKAPFPDKNPLTWHEHSLPVCLLGRPDLGWRCAVWFSTVSRKLWGKQKRAAFPQPWDMCLHCTQKNIDDS